MPYGSLRWRDLVPGIIAVGVLLVVMGATLRYGQIGRLHGATVHFHASFASARNVMGGTEVWMNGIRIGRVSNVRFTPPTTDTADRVVLDFDVLKPYRNQVRKNSTARLRSGSQIMGPTVLYLTAGTGDAPVLSANDTIRGASGADVASLAESYGDVAKELPEVIANVKVLTSALTSTRGTLGALTSLDAPKRIEALLDNASQLTGRATSNKGTLGLAIARGELIARAKSATAQADSLRALLASNRSSFGRFRRDSTLLRNVADIRDELSIAGALLSSQQGTLARMSQDSIIAVQMTEMSKQMALLFADIKKRPFRYIGF